jgi:ring-1,2-phenylacetyl-CoA epoxidase subunit PaaB
LNSLDPRVNRLPGYGLGEVKPKVPLDQFGTFEVFVQPKEGKPFQHEGVVHASDIEMAYVLAKETFTRRFTCVSLYVVDTLHVYVSPMTDGQVSAYELLTVSTTKGLVEEYEIYHLLKRGKQHFHAGTVSASSPEEAMLFAKEKYNADKLVFNIWAIQKGAIRFTQDVDKDLWLTLPDKKYRDAANYKAGDKLTSFLAKVKLS